MVHMVQVFGIHLGPRAITVNIYTNLTSDVVYVILYSGEIIVNSALLSVHQLVQHASLTPQPYALAVLRDMDTLTMNVVLVISHVQNVQAQK
jgi:hypothetical protein